MRNADLKGLYESIYKGKHGQSEKEYQDDRSDAGKMISGDSTHSGAAYSARGVKNTGPNPAGGKEKPKAQGRMGAKDREYLKYRKANMKKEEIELSEEGKKDACYHKVKASAKVWPSAYASGRLVQCRKKGAKNYGNKKEEMEMVFSFLMSEGFASTEDDALAMIDAISDEWFGSIMETLEEGVEKGGDISDWRTPQKNDGESAKEGAPKVKKFAEPNSVLSRAGKPKKDKGDEEKLKKALGPEKYAEYLKKLKG